MKGAGPREPRRRSRRSFLIPPERATTPRDPSENDARQHGVGEGGKPDHPQNRQVERDETVTFMVGLTKK